MPGNSDSSRPSRTSMSRRQVLAGAGGTGLLAATAGPAKAATRTRRARAGGAGTPEQIHLTWGESPATGVVVSWASPSQASRPRVRIGQRVIPAEAPGSTALSGSTTTSDCTRVLATGRRQRSTWRGDFHERSDEKEKRIS